MKVAQINSVCSGSTGRVAAGISRALGEQGGGGLLLYGRGGPADGIACERFGSAASFYLHAAYARLSDRQGFASARETRRMIARIESFDPDVIQLHNLHGYYLDLKTLFSYLANAGRPVVWTLHDCHAFTGHCAFFDAAGCERWLTGCGHCPLRAAYPRSVLLDRSKRNLVEKKALCSAVPDMTIVTPSDWLKNLARRSFLGKYPIMTIHNGVDRNVFHPTESDLKNRYGIGEKKLVLGVANVWEPRKGLGECIKLAERLGPDVTVALIGLSDKQRSGLPSGMIGLGRTADAKELACWYTAADAFVNPTFEDNFPTTQLEALACGTPVAAFDTGGCAEALDETCGAVVPRGDTDALAGAVRRVFSLSREDCLHRAALFDQRDRYKEYAALYGRLCGEGRA